MHEYQAQKERSIPQHDRQEEPSVHPAIDFLYQTTPRRDSWSTC